MSLNLNNTTPAAPTGNVNVLWQYDGSGNVSAYTQPTDAIVAASSVVTAAPGQIIRVNASGGAVTVNLPAASTCGGNSIRVTKTDSSANVVNITCNGSDKVVGSGVLSIAYQYSTADLESNGSNGWDVT